MEGQHGRRIVAGAAGVRTADGGARNAEALRVVRRIWPRRTRRGSSKASASVRAASSSTIAAVSEVAGGVLLALGLLDPFGAALMVAVMMVAASVHWAERPLRHVERHRSAAALRRRRRGAGADRDPDAYSLDALLGLTSLWTPVLTWSILAAGLIGGVGNLALKRPVAARRDGVTSSGGCRATRPSCSRGCSCTCGVWLGQLRAIATGPLFGACRPEFRERRPALS